MTVSSQVRRVSSSVLARTVFPFPNKLPKDVTLRDYQEDAVKSVLVAAERNIKRPAVVLATGGGKTIVMSALIPQLQPLKKTRTKTLVLAHKEELVKQACATISRLNPDLNVQIDMLKSKPNDSADVIVGSVPTLVRMTRLEMYDPLEYKMIVLDECHHATAGSWMKILNYFGALEKDLSIYVVGFTATMERADGDKLGKVFEEIVFERSLLEMVEKKELCDVKFSTIDTNIDLTDVSTRIGDYVTKRLAVAVNQKDINWQIAKGYLQLREKFNFKSTLVFCVDIEHCKTLCGVFQENGINAQYVTGETVKHERLAILQDFKDGKIQVLCNVLVFTEGTDIPNIDSMILARPTKSRPLLIQMIGRGLRLHHGKDYCHVIDMVGAGDLGYLSVPTLLGMPGKAEELEDKSLLEVEAEKVKMSAMKAQMQANEREKEVQRILRIQKRIESIELQFTTVDGFSSFEQGTMEQFNDMEMVLKKFRESLVFWVRLEYNKWGAPSGQKDSTYYTIERKQGVFDDETASDVHFELVRHIPTPMQMLLASKFKCARSREFSLQMGGLPAVLAMAEHALHQGFKYKPAENSLATSRQQATLVRGLKSKVSQVYGVKESDQLAEHISKFTLQEASNLIFAMKFSVNSLWVKWALSKMYGPPPKYQARVDRQIQKLKQELEGLSLEDQNDDKNEKNNNSSEGKFIQSDQSRDSKPLLTHSQPFAA